MFGKSSNEPPIIVETETDIWSCIKEACKGWMRKEFTLTSEPVCPFCGSGMKEEIRVLPEVNKNAPFYERVSYR